MWFDFVRGLEVFMRTSKLLTTIQLLNFKRQWPSNNVAFSVCGLTAFYTQRLTNQVSLQQPFKAFVRWEC